MIKVFKSTLLLGALFLLGSCTAENMEIPEETNMIEFYSLGINVPQDSEAAPSKAASDIQSTQIVDGAQVGIFAYQTSGTPLTNAVNNPHEVAYYTTDDNQSRAKLNPTDKKIAWPSNDSEDPVNVRAYAPYQSGNADLESLTFSVQADQSTEAGYVASDFLYSSINECKAVNGGVELMFDHLFTKVVFYLYEGNSSVVLEGATVRLNNVARTANINLASGSIESTSDKGDVVIHKFPVDQSSDYVCAAVFPAQAFAAARFLTVTDVNGKEYTVSLGNKTFETGKVYTFGVNVKTAMEIYPTAIDNWNEGHEQLNIGGGDIQSMTFMSEFVEEYAIAYYEYVDADNDGYKDTKKGDSDLELNYLVRPAEMAKTLTNQAYWNSQMKVVGYYAQALTTNSVIGLDLPMTKAFDNETFEKVIKNVTATDDGILTVCLHNEGEYDLKSDFYNGLTSAKLALTIDLDETNFTTKYVKVYAKDSDPTVYAQGINLNVTNLNLSMGADPFQLNAEVYPADVTVPGVTFESSNNEIVTVDATGKVTPSASKTGTATITVKAKSKDVNGLEIKREIPVEVTFVKPEVYVVGGNSVELGGELQLRVMVYPSSYQPSSVTWSSADESLATVDGSGIVTGTGYENINPDKDGEPIYKTVTITANVDGYTGSIDITATPLLPKYMIWTDGFGQNMDMKIGQTETFSADITPEDAIMSADENIRWWVQAPDESTGYNKHEGNQYNFTPTMEGTYTITVRHTSSNYSTLVYNQRNIDVTPYYVTSIAFNDAAHSMDQGATWTPSLTVSPSNATYKDYTLTSSNPDLLIVSGTTVTANPDYEMNTATEVVTLTATSNGKTEGGASATSTCKVTVNRVVNIIGWYYCADGQWYETLDEVSSARTSVVGVIFSMDNPTEQDSKLAASYPGAVNGYAISLTHSGAIKFVTSTPDNVTNWCTSNGYLSNSINDNNLKGFNNTKGLYAYFWQSSFTAETMPIAPYAKDNSSNWPTSAPSGSTGWFIPSIGEMRAMNANRDKVAASLSAASGQALTNAYWISSMNGMGYYYCVPWSMEFGTQANYNTRAVRYVIAF